MMLYTQYQSSRPCGSDKKICSCFSRMLAYVKHVTAGRVHFSTPGHNLNKLGRDLLGDATYQISRL